MTEKFELLINRDGETPTVSGRELHEALGVKDKYSQWFSRMCEYGFSEYQDFFTILGKSAGGRPATDHQLTIDTAKEICMIQRSEKGREIRRYFIEVEKQYCEHVKNAAQIEKQDSYQIEDPIERAKRWIEEQEERKQLALTVSIQTQQIAELQPKADYTDVILRSVGTVTVTQIAKDYGMGAPTFNQILHDLGIQYKQGGQWLLYSKYQSLGWTKSATYAIQRADGRDDAVLHTRWTQKGRLALYQILKDAGYLPIIER